MRSSGRVNLTSPSRKMPSSICGSYGCRNRKKRKRISLGMMQVPDLRHNSKKEKIRVCRWGALFTYEVLKVADSSASSIKIRTRLSFNDHQETWLCPFSGRRPKRRSTLTCMRTREKTLSAEFFETQNKPP